MPNKKEFKQLIIWFLIWRLGLLLVGATAKWFLPYQPSFPYAAQLANYGLPAWLFSWANFDGVHYLTIINQGYFGTGLIQAFFPLFPLLIKFFNLLLGNSLITGLVISNALAFILVVTFYQFGKKILSKNPGQTWAALLIMLTFPTSFFLAAFYTESLFLILALQSFLAAKNQRWWLASLLAGLASATKVVGIFVIGGVIATYVFGELSIWQLSKQSITAALSKIKQDWPKLAAILVVGSSGLIAYMIYLQVRYEDLLYFLHVQEEFGGGRQEALVPYPQVVWRYLKILLTARPFDFKYLSYLQEAVAGIAGVVLIIGASRKINIGYLLFCLGAFLVPTLTGTFSSLPRYLLVIWPIYFVIASKLAGSRWWNFYLVLSLLLLLLNTVLFVQGYWVA